MFRYGPSLSLISGSRFVTCGGGVIDLGVAMSTCVSWAYGERSWTKLYNIRCLSWSCHFKNLNVKVTNSANWSNANGEISGHAITTRLGQPQNLNKGVTTPSFFLVDEMTPLLGHSAIKQKRRFVRKANLQNSQQRLFQVRLSSFFFHCSSFRW